MDQDTQRFQTTTGHAGDPPVVHLRPVAQPAAGVPAQALHGQRHVLLVDRPPRGQVRRAHGDTRTSTTSPTTTAPACGSSTPTGRSTQADPTTWPTRFTLGSGPATRNYQNTEWGFFAQDDVRLGNVTLNLGLRYDFDSNLRSPDLIADLLANPQFAGLENMVTADRGNDLNNIQPRLGFAWDARGDGRTVLRGGYGLYSGRNRPWFNIRGDVVSNQFTAEVTDPNLLQFYPDQTRRARRPHARGLHPHRRRPRALPARRRPQPAVRRQRHGRHRQDAARRHLARGRLHPPGAEGPADRARRQPAGARTARHQPAAVPAVLVGDADQLADQFELRRAAGAAAAALSRHHLAGVLHLSPRRSRTTPTTTPAPTPTPGTRSATTTAASTRTTAGTRSRCR